MTGHATDTIYTGIGGNIPGRADTVRDALETANSKKVVIASCMSDGGIQGLGRNHVYSVFEYDRKKDTVWIRNPYGEAVDPKYATGLPGELKLPFNVFYANFRAVAVETDETSIVPRR